MRYRLLVTDLDGTLVTSTREITPRVLTVVRAAQQRGVRVCLATGRMWPSTEPFARRLGADPPAILYNGGLVYDFSTSTVLRRVPLPYAAARAVLEMLREFPSVQPHLYVDDRVFASGPSEETDRYSRRNGLLVELVGDLIAFLPSDAMKILIIGTPGDLAAVLAQIHARSLPVHAVFSDPTFLEILPQGSSKGTALEFMAQWLRIPLAEVIAVGDNLNDLEMIRAAGLGVAMGNAPPDVQSQADYVTATNDKEGLADVIERFVLADVPAGGSSGDATTKNVRKG
jgi:Cof subfamily protein (haloacid dehalogenase superfamily)